MALARQCHAELVAIDVSWNGFAQLYDAVVCQPDGVTLEQLL